MFSMKYSFSKITKYLVAWLISLWLFTSVFAQSTPRLSRNIFIDVYTPQKTVVGFGYKSNQGIGEYLATSKTKDGWNNQIVIQKSNINESDIQWVYTFAVEKDKKLNFITVNMPFSSLEAIKQRSKVELHVTLDEYTSPNGTKDNLIRKNIDGIHITASEAFTVKAKEYKDIKTDITFPNALGIRTFNSVWALAWIVFILSGWFFIFIKEVIKT